MAAIYFISDIHLGLQDEGEEQRKLEGLARLFAGFREGDALYMLGDVFDYWMEFRHVIPKGLRVFVFIAGIVITDNTPKLLVITCTSVWR